MLRFWRLSQPHRCQSVYPHSKCILIEIPKEWEHLPCSLKTTMSVSGLVRLTILLFLSLAQSQKLHFPYCYFNLDQSFTFTQFMWLLWHHPSCYWPITARWSEYQTKIGLDSESRVLETLIAFRMRRYQRFDISVSEIREELLHARGSETMGCFLSAEEDGPRSYAPRKSHGDHRW